MQHNGVVLKLEQNDISGYLYMILQDYIDKRKEAVVLNGQVFSSANVTAGVPLRQCLVQCSFSSALMIYRKVSLVGTTPHPAPPPPPPPPPPLLKGDELSKN